MKYLIGVCFFLSIVSSAENIKQKIRVEGATCGNGDPYYVFLRQGDPNKVLFFFEGGGMCWDKKTCFSFPVMGRTKWKETQTNDGIFSATNPDNPLRDYTLVHFPYCTGDIFVGNHEATYQGKKVRHSGRRNLELAFRTLREEGFSAKRATHVVAYGHSAGALGVALNMDLLDEETNMDADRVMISDAPGAHFHRNVWKRFDVPYFQDIERAYARIGLEIDPKSFQLARRFQGLCENFPLWRMGFLQATKDTVMSVFFGKMLPLEHELMVLGKSGIYEALKGTRDQCSSFTPRSRLHGFLTDLKSWFSETKEHVSAKSYLLQLLDKDRPQLSYK